MLRQFITFTQKNQLFLDAKTFIEIPTSVHKQTTYSLLLFTFKQPTDQMDPCLT